MIKFMRCASFTLNITTIGNFFLQDLCYLKIPLGNYEIFCVSSMYCYRTKITQFFLSVFRVTKIAHYFTHYISELQYFWKFIKILKFQSYIYSFCGNFCNIKDRQMCASLKEPSQENPTKKLIPNIPNKRMLFN